MANNGGHKVGAHGQSSGTGRLVTALTRYQAESLFDTIVFSGGPIMAYPPWFCGITDDGDPNNGIAAPGPLGPKPPEFDIEAYDLSFRITYDNARDPNNGIDPTRYHKCADHIWDPTAMMEDSNFYLASDRDFSTVDMAVILGGYDGSPASPLARLWFQGYAYGAESIPAISARSLTFHQGYCQDPTDPTATYTANKHRHPCTDWDPSRFPTATTVTYVPEIAAVGHDIPSSLEGATELFHTMLSTLELIPTP